MIELKHGNLSARIAPKGAELVALAANGRDILWTPDNAVWDGTCPVLFPVIGRVNHDTIRMDNTEYPMPMHGFALTSMFRISEQTERECTLELRSSAQTREHYPFDFTLRITHRLSKSSLQIKTEIVNEGEKFLPASFGLHPGFRWPMTTGIPKDRHYITFEEMGPIAYTRPVDRLIGPDRSDLPLNGSTLQLNEALFEPGGMALLSLKSRSLLFHTEDRTAAIRLDFPDMDGIILWSRPGADFLCIEPLLGHADPVGFSGDIMEKPGMAHIAPRETLTLSVTITPEFSAA